MVVYVVYSVDEDKTLFSTDSYERAVEFAEKRLARGWSMRDGRYYCPVVIWDIWVHDKHCSCPSFCGGTPEVGEVVVADI